MKHSIKKGFSFGLTSGVITTLGLIVGLHSGTNSSKIVIGGILIIAIADAMSDALGIHVSEECENNHTTREIWEATISTFLMKFFVSSIFIIPFLFLSLFEAARFSIVFGLLLISVFSYFIAKDQKIKPYGVIGEHLLIVTLVIVITHYVGDFINRVF